MVLTVAHTQNTNYKFTNTSSLWRIQDIDAYMSNNKIFTKYNFGRLEKLIVYTNSIHIIPIILFYLNINTAENLYPNLAFIFAKF